MGQVIWLGLGSEMVIFARITSFSTCFKPVFKLSQAYPMALALAIRSCYFPIVVRLSWLGFTVNAVYRCYKGFYALGLPLNGLYCRCRFLANTGLFSGLCWLLVLLLWFVCWSLWFVIGEWLRFTAEWLPDSWFLPV